MTIAIRVEGLGKKFHLGQNFEHTIGSRIGDMLRGKNPIFRSAPREEFWALRDVNFEVNEGEAVAIIGGNGAGKSTLLKILSRITPPTTGRASVRGRLASLLEVGTGFHPELTGRENVFLNGAVLGMRKAEVQRKFDEIVAFSGVGKFIDTPVKRYSSGMYVRLAFAVAAHLEPDVLVIDEVLAVGDAEFQKRCLGRMGEVVRDGRTVLFVSHNLSAVSRLCTKGVLLAGGQVQSVGDIDEVLRSYLVQDSPESSLIELPAPPDDSVGAAVSLQFESGSGQPLRKIPFGHPWQARIRFEIKEPLPHFVASFGIRTPLGVSIRTAWTRPQALSPGVYELVFREELLWFTPGVYEVSIGLTNYLRAFHYIEEAGNVEFVRADMSGLEDGRIASDSVGILLNQMTSKVLAVGQASAECQEGAETLLVQHEPLPAAKRS
jgi:lipopolysaccharide transport system ATP-binding protein